ncbi:MULTISPECIES: hypothetical protein [Streptomyces]|uniref:Uncharacterized protein n=1 Tax=Streptomyces gilvifuscus TaxID=1550617 RepID=A0ABT5G7H1_9ACTN|nr:MULTISPECIES: hypothetical protein [Streptomyces]MBK3645240.1 hypothetical protein [Streptomyces sp. MBT33]MDC2960823.1 hypothetical protein [Streptomyces gilvifuscus]
MWPFVLMGSAILVVVLGAVGAFEFMVHRMSDPATTIPVGLRIDGSRVSFKAPVCAGETVRTVEVYDSDSEDLLWRAQGPRTAGGRSGAVTLWAADDFRTARPKAPPGTLPKWLDVSVTYADGDGTGDVFEVRKVRAAGLPAGRYWTREGPMTAAEIDARLSCRGHRTGVPS